MDFSKELTVFPSVVHKIIYSSAREIIPLEHSLSGIDDASLRSSCEEYHQFIMDMLSDMYEFPEAYELPALELEHFLDGRKLNGMKQKYPSKTKSILSHTRNTVDRYMALLSKIAYMGTPYEDRLDLSSEVYPIIEKAINTSTSPISCEKRFKALSRIGLKQVDTGFISVKHPNMFPGLCALAQKTKGNTSGFSFYNFTKIDFRNINKNYKPSYMDYYLPLIKERQKTAFQLHEIAKQYGCREQINTFLKVDYKYNGTQVMLVDSSEGNVHVRLTETYAWNDSSLINERLRRESVEFQKQALRHLWRCNACSTSHLGQYIDVLGKKNRVCGGGGIGFQWDNPSVEDIEMIKRLIEMRCDIINELRE